MLTSDLAMSWTRGDQIRPRYLNPDAEEYLRAADDLILLVRNHQQRRHAELQKALDDYIGVGTDYRILRGLIKLLVDRCEFETVAPMEPAELRQRLFLRAFAHHPVLDRAAVLALAAEELNISAEQILDSLYADLHDNQRLVSFDDLDARALLDGYNIAQAQALFYRCVELTLWIEPQAPSGYRQLFDAIKHYRLIHSIRGNAALGYEIRLSGPVSLFHRSQKYGIQMAVFLPALLACQGWRLRAEIESKTKPIFYELNSEQKQLYAAQFDTTSEENPVLEKLLSKWADSEWTLERCAEVLDLGETAFAPDLKAVRGGQAVYIELFGFWTPRYLQQRLLEFQRGGMRNYLLAVSEEWRGSRDEPTNLPANVLVYKTALDARALRVSLNQLIGVNE
jgi:predicted nuclease of restriction endonuclease-like RecB superfamily